VKTLTLVRHAKSSWKDPGLEDHERPLNKRGRRDAPASARRFASACPAPGRILVSPASRTRETAQEFLRALGLDERALVEDSRIYEASHARLLSILREQPEESADLMLIGHSPGVADLGHALCGQPEGKFPTCAILRIRLPDKRWSQLAEGDGEPEFFDTPKQPVLAAE